MIKCQSTSILKVTTNQIIEYFGALSSEATLSICLSGSSLSSLKSNWDQNYFFRQQIHASMEFLLRFKGHYPNKLFFFNNVLWISVGINFQEGGEHKKKKILTISPNTKVTQLLSRTACILSWCTKSTLSLGTTNTWLGSRHDWWNGMRTLVSWVKVLDVTLRPSWHFFAL